MHEIGWPPRRSFICFRPLSNSLKYHHAGLQLRLSILNGWYPHRGAYEWDYSCLWPPFDPISPSWAKGQHVKVQALESIRDLSKHKDSLRLHFGHRWLTHFGCASGFQNFATHFTHFLDDVLFQDAMHIDDLPLLGDAHVCFEHFVLMCSSSTFVFHLDNTFIFFLLVFFGEFQ